MTPQEEYEHYKRLNRDFTEAYASSYQMVMDFYPLPQKFIQEATPEIDNQVEKFWACRNNPTEQEVFRDFFYFAKNFKEFAGTANSIFEEYKELHGESGKYIKTVFRLKEKDPGHITPVAYNELIPVLHKLIGGFKEVKQKTEKAAQNLNELKSEWRSLKEKIEVPKGSIRPL